MPTIMRVGPYRFYFYSADGGEPPHVHVERDSGEAKYWLSPVRLANSRGVSPVDLREIERIVIDNEAEFLDRWHEFFRN